LHTEDEDPTRYRVVVNDEEQYSIWPSGREIPSGWREDGFEGTKAECLAHVDEVWTDMRPLSLRSRDAKEGAAKRGGKRGR
jgi:MbtH protein